MRREDFLAERSAMSRDEKDKERERVVRRQNGCNHRSVERSYGVWMCVECDQPFVPVFGAP